MKFFRWSAQFLQVQLLVAVTVGVLAEDSSIAVCNPKWSFVASDRIALGISLNKDVQHCFDKNKTIVYGMLLGE